MDYTLQIGQKVKNKKGEVGTLVEVGKYIIIDFKSRKATIQPDAFVKGILSFVDESLQKQVEIDIETIKVEEAKRIEEIRIAEEKELEERKNKAEEPSIKAKRKKPIKIEDMFDANFHIEHMKRQPILTYQEVEKQFGIKISGFGRGINVKSDSIVLISSMEKKGGSFVYHDHWTEGGDYIYSGEGKIGDQALTKGNKAIADSAADGKCIYLFIKLSSSEYYYQGIFVFVDYTLEDEKDENGNIRKEYKFRLRKTIT